MCSCTVDWVGLVAASPSSADGTVSRRYIAELCTISETGEVTLTAACILHKTAGV